MATDLMKEISFFTDLKTFVDFLFEKIKDIAAFDYGHLFLFEKELEKLKLYRAVYPAYYRGMQKVAQGLELPLDQEGFEQECFYSDEVELFYDQSLKSRYNEGFKLNFEGKSYSTTLGIPLRSQKQTVGVLVLYYENEKLKKTEVDKISDLTSVTSQQLKTCHFIDSMQKELDQVETLLLRNKKLSVLTSELNFLSDKETVYRTFMEKLMQVFQFQIASVQLKKGDSLPITAVAWAEDRYKAYSLAAKEFFSIPENTIQIKASEGAAAVAFLNNAQFYFEDIQELKNLNMTEKDRKGMELIEKFYPGELRSILIVPIQESGKVIGVLQLWSFKKPVLLSANDIEVIKNICSFISTTIKNSELYQKLMEKNKIIENKNKQMRDELKLAQNIQENLIPSVAPEIKGVEFASLYKPMEDVGGDFFDFIRVREPDVLGIYISDVSGHGVPAALITSMQKALLEAAGPNRLNPEKLLHYINEKITDQTGGNFLTAFYSVYHSRKKVLEYARAAHNYPYLIRDKKIILLESKGPIIGAMKDLSFEKKSIQLLPRDKVLFYTDGLTEATNPQGEEFETIIDSVILDYCHFPIQEMVNQIYHRLLDFREEFHFDDDICMVGLEIALD